LLRFVKIEFVVKFFQFVVIFVFEFVIQFVVKLIEFVEFFPVVRERFIRERFGRLG